MKKQIYSKIALIGILLLNLSLFYSCIQEESFTKATIETSQVTLVTEATANCGGVISFDGGSNVTVRGVCWRTSPNPTIENDTTIDAAGTGPFSSFIKGLTPSTTYYVRAYAVNKGGVEYGLQLTFTTKTFSITTLPIAISSITATSVICGGNIISDGDSSSLTVTARGVCWNTDPSPTIENNRTTDGVGGGRFTSVIEGLRVFTTYYVRSYATNSVGTIYGNEISFSTLSGVILLTTNAVSLISATTATCGGIISSDGGVDIESRGVCWSTSHNPTTSNSKTVDNTVLNSFISNLTGLSAYTHYYVRAYAINSVGTSYGNEVSFTTTSIVTDVDGNEYNTVIIGTQVWMIENLRTTKYNDGTSIPLVTDLIAWTNIRSPGYCFYNNDATNKNKYGALYNWYTVNTGKLAPTGWHVPTDAEWTTLENYLITNGYNYDGTTTGNKIAKSLATTTGWATSTNEGAIGNDLSRNNSSGFTGLPSGALYDWGQFVDIGEGVYWWSSTEYNTSNSWFRSMGFRASNVGRSYYLLGKQCGFAVRCLRDY